MIELYLIRHGQSEANTKMWICGQLDSVLTDLGREQARLLQPYLQQELRPDAVIVSSPLSRAHETARIAALGRGIHVETGVAELNTGQFSGLTYDELYAREPRFKAMNENLDLPFPGGESIRSLSQRVQTWFNQRASGLNGRQLVLFSHAYALNCLLHYLHRTPLEQYPSFAIPNASVLKIRLQGTPESGYQLISQSLHDPGASA